MSDQPLLDALDEANAQRLLDAGWFRVIRWTQTYWKRGEEIGLYTLREAIAKLEAAEKGKDTSP